MKIILISDITKSSEDKAEIQSVFSGLDQVIELDRTAQGLRVDRVDIASVDLIIVNSSKLVPEDLRTIASLTSSPPWPAIIYISETSTNDELLALMRAGVNDVINLPLNSAELKQAIDRIRFKHGASRPKTEGQVLAFLSSKGGAGATFLSSNIGYILATEYNQRVLLIDLHMQGGDAAFYLTNNTSSSSVAELAKHSDLDQMMLLTGSIEIEPNYFLLQAPDSPEKSAGLQASHIDNLIAIALKEFDFVIIDSPHILDGITIKALDRAATIFVITQPIMTYLRAVTNVLHLFNRLDYEPNKVRVVLNRMDEVGVLSIAKVEDSIQKKISTTIPNDFKNGVESVNLGLPITKIAFKSPISDALRAIAADITGRQTQAQVKTSWIKTLLGK